MKVGAQQRASQRPRTGGEGAVENYGNTARETIGLGADELWKEPLITGAIGIIAWMHPVLMAIIDGGRAPSFNKRDTTRTLNEL